MANPLSEEQELEFELALRLLLQEKVCITEEYIRQMCVELCNEQSVVHNFGEMAPVEWYNGFMKRRPFLYVTNNINFRKRKLNEDDDDNNSVPPPKKSKTLWKLTRVTDAASIIRLEKKKMVVGRLNANTPVDIVAEENAMVSNIHATINVDGDRVSVMDHSKHGTFVNGLQIQSNVEHSLSHNDILRFGTKKFSFFVEREKLAAGVLKSSSIKPATIVSADRVVKSSNKNTQQQVETPSIGPATNVSAGRVQRSQRVNSTNLENTLRQETVPTLQNLMKNLALPYSRTVKDRMIAAICTMPTEASYLSHPKLQAICVQLFQSQKHCGGNRHNLITIIQEELPTFTGLTRPLFSVEDEYRQYVMYQMNWLKNRLENCVPTDNFNFEYSKLIVDAQNNVPNLLPTLERLMAHPEAITVQNELQLLLEDLSGGN